MTNNSELNINFLIVGTMRTGTTSLHHYLQSHPAVFMPERKDLWFFLSESFKDHPKEDPRFYAIQQKVSNFNDFAALYQKVTDEKAIGETSTAYLYKYQEAIPTIKRHLGDVKVIIGLRNPVERAYSQYYYNLKNKWEQETFEGALEKEHHRINLRWDPIWALTDMGRYYNQVNAYISNFSEVFIYTFDELQSNPRMLIKRTFDFLEVDDNFIPPNLDITYNKSGTLNNSKMHVVQKIYGGTKRLFKKYRALKSVRYWFDKHYYRTFNKSLQRNEMHPDTKAALQKQFEPEIINLQSLIKKDLSNWLIK